MKKIFLLMIAFFFVCSLDAQNVNSKSKKAETENIYTALMPKDGQPAVFNSKAELDAKIADKKNGIINLIKANEKDTEKVKYYREELWRFENAIVKEPGK